MVNFLTDDKSSITGARRSTRCTACSRRAPAANHPVGRLVIRSRFFYAVPTAANSMYFFFPGNRRTAARSSRICWWGGGDVRTERSYFLLVAHQKRQCYKKKNTFKIFQRVGWTRHLNRLFWSYATADEGDFSSQTRGVGPHTTVLLTVKICI